MIYIINKDDFLADLQEYLNDQEAIALDINEDNEYLVNDKSLPIVKIELFLRHIFVFYLLYVVL